MFCTFLNTLSCESDEKRNEENKMLAEEIIGSLTGSSVKSRLYRDRISDLCLCM